MNEEIIGREKEKKVLLKCLKKRSSSFIILHGRRRVGKTFLIDKLFYENEDVNYIMHSGDTNRTSKQEISIISNELKKYGEKAKSWKEVFDAFGLISESSDKKLVVFLDEIPWLDKKKSDFYSYLSLFVQRLPSRFNNLILIVAGSVGSWMDSRIISNREAFFNRSTENPLHIKPFTLKETREYLLRNRNLYLNDYDLIISYMHFGGLAGYLQRVPDFYGKKSDEVPLLKILSVLDDDFYKKEEDELMLGLFGKSQAYKDILFSFLEKKAIKAEDLVDDNYGRKRLDALQQSNFIMKVKSSVNGNIIDKYVLIDEFWQNVLLRKKNKILNSSSMGIRFEKILLKHIDLLGFNGTVFFDLALEKNQIDFLIHSKNISYILEAKFSEDSFYIKDSYLKEMENRKENVKNWLKLKKMNYRIIEDVLITVAGAGTKEVNIDNHILVRDKLL